jgi:hypothetical protein
MKVNTKIFERSDDHIYTNIWIGVASDRSFNICISIIKKGVVEESKMGKQQNRHGNQSSIPIKMIVEYSSLYDQYPIYIQI